jgi:uncharacterized membrane protein YkgB
MNTESHGPIERAGRGIALAGVVLPLVMIGGLKFTTFEVEALKPMLAATPWLAWMLSAFGPVGASRMLGVMEIITALLLTASVRMPRAGIAGGLLSSLTFLVTLSMMLSLPVWEASLGGFPALSGAGQFLMKDVALLGISLVVLGENLRRVRGRSAPE